MLNSYWVLPGRFLAGEYPGTAGESETRLRLRWLLSRGVSWILDLTEAGEYGLLPYAGLLPGKAAYQRLPIRDFGTPSREEMHRIQGALRSALAAGQTVYVHCYGGVGRTGTVVGCYLREQGYAGQEALAEIARLRRGLPNGWRPSPETDAQRQMIVAWELIDDRD